MNYKFWKSVNKLFPKKLANILFAIYPLIMNYWIGIKSVVCENYYRIRKFKQPPLEIPEKLPDNFVAIITGGSLGIGLQVAKDLCRRKCSLIVTSFNQTKEEQATVLDLITDACSGDQKSKVFIWEVDLRNLSSVFGFVTRFYSHFGHLDMLINNAGVMLVKQGYTVDGFETHYQINYLSHVLMTWLLLPALGEANKAQPSRIVNITSTAHYGSSIFLEDLQSISMPYSPHHAYSQSKLCILLFTYYLTEFINSNNSSNYRIHVNALHPGIVNTGLYQNSCLYYFGKLTKFFMKTPEEASQNILHAALSSRVETSGEYYQNCASVRSSKSSYKKHLQDQLERITTNQLTCFVERFSSEHPDLKVPRCLSNLIIKNQF